MKLQKRNWLAQEPFNEFSISSLSIHTTMHYIIM
ncbi:hypothetical protein ERO13_D13G236333v2 [Gossypium hirsutum]|nr:hypothetical protein ERO13_D13G236333v2 [Gossypium hirsutum]